MRLLFEGGPQNPCDSVREAPYVHTDGAGWRTGGLPAWLMVFETDAATVYQIRKRHRNEEVRERTPADYDGVRPYDHPFELTWTNQKLRRWFTEHGT